MKIKKLLPLLLLLCGTAAFFIFTDIDIAALRMQIASLQDYVMRHYLQAVAIYIVTYTLVTALSLPLALLMTLTGGFLFGAVFGTLYTVSAATLGASLIFSATRYALGDWLAQKVAGFMHHIKDGFNENAFAYMLTLRLIPIFPFWVVNIAPALLSVRLKTFALSTFIGIIPATFVFSLAGAGLGDAFGASDFSLKSVVEPKLLIALSGLGLLALLPPLYKLWKKRRYAK